MRRTKKILKFNKELFLNQVQGLSNFKSQHQNVGQALPDNKTKSHSKLDLESHHTLLRNDEIVKLYGLTPVGSSAVLLNQVQDNRKCGFTLIELLVVVFIIGILAAVALPQYQKAVEKNRAAEALVIGNKLKQAQQLRYLQTGEWDGINKDSLDIDISGGTWNENGGVYYTRNFMYTVEDGDFVNVNRCKNPQICDVNDNLYVLIIYADEESYGPKACANENNTSVGTYICDWLTAYGFTPPITERD